MDGDFYSSLRSFTAFERIADADSYVPLPDDWVIGLADVVSSTQAIGEGRYKAVNMAGAAVVSAVSNALGSLDFPYVFTGDGMCCAVGPAHATVMRDALAATVDWVGEALDLRLRGAVIGLPAIRATGRDVRIARFNASAHASYAMFSGGGLAWAEAELKAGRLPPLEPVLNSRPDLSGLSCRFKSISSTKGVILSLIVTPRSDGATEQFRDLVNDVLTLVAGSEEAGRPMPATGPAWAWPPQGWGMEARLHRGSRQPLLLSSIAVGFRTLFAAIIVWVGRDVGGFSPARYRAQLAENSDFRKYEDGLMMTVDCTAALAERIEARLIDARAEGIVDFGVHRQNSALITCVVPAPSRPGHIHFIDGASGGYTIAARNLKQSRRPVSPAERLRESGETP